MPGSDTLALIIVIVIFPSHPIESIDTGHIPIRLIQWPEVTIILVAAAAAPIALCAIIIVPIIGWIPAVVIISTVPIAITWTAAIARTAAVAVSAI